MQKRSRHFSGVRFGENSHFSARKKQFSRAPLSLLADRIQRLRISLFRALNPALGRQIDRKTAEPVSALVMFAGDGSDTGATMRLSCR